MLFTGGCKNKTDEITGCWKSTEIGLWNKNNVCIINSDSIKINGREKYAITIEENKDGSLQIKGKDGINLRIEIIDKNTIGLYGGLMSGEYTRTTPEDVEVIIKSPPQKTENKAWTAF